MSAGDKIVFDAIIAEALKRMQETVTTSVSSAYVVHRSGGELIVHRSDKAWQDSSAVELPLAKKAA